MGIHRYSWISQMNPTGFGYGYSQFGIPSYSQPKEGEDAVTWVWMLVVTLPAAQNWIQNWPP